MLRPLHIRLADLLPIYRKRIRATSTTNLAFKTTVTTQLNIQILAMLWARKLRNDGIIVTWGGRLKLVEPET
jgi:hypothetical protein